MKKLILCAAFVSLLSGSAQAANLIFKNVTGADWVCHVTTQKLSRSYNISAHEEKTTQPPARVRAFCNNQGIYKTYPLVCNKSQLIDLTKQDITLHITEDQRNAFSCHL